VPFKNEETVKRARGESRELGLSQKKVRLMKIVGSRRGSLGSIQEGRATTIKGEKKKKRLEAKN